MQKRIIVNLFLMFFLILFTSCGIKDIYSMGYVQLCFGVNGVNRQVDEDWYTSEELVSLIDKYEYDIQIQDDINGGQTFTSVTKGVLLKNQSKRISLPVANNYSILVIAYQIQNQEEKFLFKQSSWFDVKAGKTTVVELEVGKNDFVQKVNDSDDNYKFFDSTQIGSKEKPVSSTNELITALQNIKPAASGYPSTSSIIYLNTENNCQSGVDNFINVGNLDSKYIRHKNIIFRCVNENQVSELSNKEYTTVLCGESTFFDMEDCIITLDGNVNLRKQHGRDDSHTLIIVGKNSVFKARNCMIDNNRYSSMFEIKDTGTVLLNNIKYEGGTIEEDGVDYSFFGITNTQFKISGSGKLTCKKSDINLSGYCNGSGNHYNISLIQTNSSGNSRCPIIQFKECNIMGQYDNAFILNDTAVLKMEDVSIKRNSMSSANDSNHPDVYTIIDAVSSCDLNLDKVTIDDSCKIDSSSSYTEKPGIIRISDGAYKTGSLTLNSCKLQSSIINQSGIFNTNIFSDVTVNLSGTNTLQNIYLDCTENKPKISYSSQGPVTTPIKIILPDFTPGSENALYYSQENGNYNSETPNRLFEFYSFDPSYLKENVSGVFEIYTGKENELAVSSGLELTNDGHISANANDFFANYNIVYNKESWAHPFYSFNQEENKEIEINDKYYNYDENCQRENDLLPIKFYNNLSDEISITSSQYPIFRISRTNDVDKNGIKQRDWDFIIDGGKSSININLMNDPDVTLVNNSGVSSDDYHAMLAFYSNQNIKLRRVNVNYGGGGAVPSVPINGITLFGRDTNLTLEDCYFTNVYSTNSNAVSICMTEQNQHILLRGNNQLEVIYLQESMQFIDISELANSRAFIVKLKSSNESVILNNKIFKGFEYQTEEFKKDFVSNFESKNVNSAEGYTYSINVETGKIYRKQL